jgi:hypothetical protein
MRAPPLRRAPGYRGRPCGACRHGHVNGPPLSKRLSKRSEDLAVAFAQDLERPLAAAGSVRRQIRVEGRCLSDPDALHDGKTRPVDEGKTLLREFPLDLPSRF